MSDDSRRAIQAAREALNDAIARRDLTGIAQYLAADYHIVTALNTQRDSREASVRSWAEMFESDPAAAYRRTPGEIHINEELGLAQEHGRWSGTMTTPGGVIELGGIYAAKWLRTAEGWQLRAEIYTPLTAPSTPPA